VILKVAPPSEQPSPLDPGDRVTVSITHQLRINGDDSWVKLEHSSRVREGETAEQADARVFGYVNTTIVDMCEQTAATVIGHAT